MSPNCSGPRPRRRASSSERRTGSWPACSNWRLSSAARPARRSRSNTPRPSASGPASRSSYPAATASHICFDAAEPTGALDPAVRAAVDGLLADGVSTKVAANALATLAGWDRRRAYDTVLNWRGDRRS